MNKSGFQRAADGISEYESQNRFPVRCNFAQQNCVKDYLLCPRDKSAGYDRLASFEVSKLETDGKLVMSFSPVIPSATPLK